jgi:hypothetical protein
MVRTACLKRTCACHGLQTECCCHARGAPSYSASALDIMDDSEMYSMSSPSVTSTPCRAHLYAVRSQ